MKVTMGSDWRKAQKLMAKIRRQSPEAARHVILKAGHQLRKDIKDGIESGAPGGERIAPLSPGTIAARKGKDKIALKDSGEMYKAIQLTLVKGGGAFIGVKKGKTGKDGRDLATIAAVHEYGSKRRVMKLTPKMRAKIAMTYARAGKGKGGGKGGGGTQVVVVRTPARPFIQPSIDAWRKWLEGWLAREYIRVLLKGG